MPRLDFDCSFSDDGGGFSNFLFKGSLIQFAYAVIFENAFFVEEDVVEDFASVQYITGTGLVLTAQT